MSGRIISVILMILIPFLLSGKIIKSSKIEKRENSVFKISRNIFSPEKMGKFQRRGNASLKIDKKKIELVKQEEKKKNQVIAMVFYEGFLIKEGQKYALLKVNGRYHILKEGDSVPGNILVKKILKKKIVLEIEANEVSVSKKGERNAI